MIWLTQFLCPDRHAAIAAAWDDAENTREQVEECGWAAMARDGINGWCGICGGALVPEHAPTAFGALADAHRVMAALQREQRASRRLLDALGLTHDVKRGRPGP